MTAQQSHQSQTIEHTPRRHRRVAILEEEIQWRVRVATAARVDQQPSDRPSVALMTGALDSH
jgi:hypothetical protein